MAVRIQLRRDTTSNWGSNNPVLALGEIGLDVTSGNFKIGDGTSQWSQLDYFSTAVDDVISQAQLNSAIAAIGGDGLVFDSENSVYDIDLSQVSQNIIPDIDETYDLGSSSKKWRDLYLSGNTIFLGDIQLKDNGDGTFGVFGTDGSTTLETVLLPGQVTDTELSSDSADLKSRFAGHRDATNNPHSVTAEQVGLGNVTNESKATMFTDPTFTGTVSGVTATHVGLGNVTNESKATMFTDAALTGIPIAPTPAASTNTTQIATAAFVQSEINSAALALGTNYSVADIAARDSLQNLVVGDVVFVANDGDSKWAQYKVTAIGPVVFLKIMDQDIFLNALSAADVKAAYESNADTNAFTDALKSKLETTDIFDEAGTYSNLRAQATTASDVGLGNVTNESKTTMFTDPTFTGTVNGVTSTMVGLGNVTNESKTTMFTDPTFTGTVSGVTATMVGLGNVTNNLQATKSEFDSHTQDSTIHFTQTQISITESQISDLGTYEPADATILKSADIGTTVQGFNANTVIDANYETFDSSGTYANLRAQATTASDVGLGNVTNESKATMFTDPTFTGTVTGVTASHVGLGNVTNESKTTMFSNPTFTGTVSGVTASMVGLGNVTNESKATMFTDSALTGIPTAPTAAAATSTTQIATTAFVQSEINAANLALGTNFSVGDIAGRDALTDLTVGDIVFVANDGDGKWAQYKVTAIGPVTFLKIMDEDIMLNALNASNIKSSYESNADTNAFTDALLSKLNGIEENAKDDQNASEVDYDNQFTNLVSTTVQSAIDESYNDYINHKNDSTIHFTQAQISITESQISDFGNYEIADATILKSADIGITVQAFNANTVIDANYETFDSSATYTNLRAQGTTAEDVGLGNVTNESKLTIFTNPEFTGVPVAPTAAPNTNTTQIATTAFVQNAVSNIDGGEFN